MKNTGKDKTVVMAFGRMNPPTAGHAKVIETMQTVGKGYDLELVLAYGQDAKKNPLSATQKLKYVRQSFPGVTVSLASKASPSFISHATRLAEKGYTDLIFVAGSDRVHEYQQILKKYNGKDYTFKTIKVISAGERDADAEGVQGLSASKMREYAVKGNFDEFKKGVPDNLSVTQTKDLYHDVRIGMNLKESLAVLAEGVHDAAIFKAVFLAGGPGSGKDFILKRTLDGHGLTEINSDKALEFLMDKGGLDKKMPASERDKREPVRAKAKSVTELRQRLAIDGRNGLIINGTADDPEKIFRIKAALEKQGYSTSMVFVNTSDEVSKKRNLDRGSKGGRTVPEDIRKEKWENSMKSLKTFEETFGGSFHTIDNSADLSDPKLDPAILKSQLAAAQKIWKNVHAFTERGPEDPAAQAWITDALGKQTDHAHVQKHFGLGKGEVQVKDSAVSQEAGRLGLQYYGFGRYGKKGRVTHKADAGHLRPIETKIPTPGASTSDAPAKPKINESPEIAASGVLVESIETEIERIAQTHHMDLAVAMAALERGIEVECERTHDDTTAMRIALDNLYDRPDYYTRPEAAKLSLAEVKKKLSESTLNEETYHADDFFTEYDVMWFNEDDQLDEGEYQGRTVKLGKPMQGDVKKFKVYVRKPTGNIVKVNFGDPNMRIKKSNPARRRSFRARHNCDNPGPRTKARYWSCRKW